jgi:hypothetical protein
LDTNRARADPTGEGNPLLATEPTPTTFAVPVYVADPRKTEPAYVSVAKVRTDSDLSRDVLITELKRCIGNLRRAAGLALGFELGLDGITPQVEAALTKVERSSASDTAQVSNESGAQPLLPAE